MSDAPSSLDRIETALARIEAAARRRAYAADALARRHALLRDRVSDAMAELDAVIAAQAQAEGGR